MAIKILSYNLLPKQKCYEDDILSSQVFDIHFPSPIGLAAGFDKDGSAISGLSSQGFGFLEVGTVTPLPQEGNPKPRIFRLNEDKAIINRMGFNNLGVKNLCANLQRNLCGETQGKMQGENKFKIIVGANIGKNKNSPNDSSDYVKMLHDIYGLSNYIAINISSPNTPNIRDIQGDAELNIFLQEIMDVKNKLQEKSNINIPIILKIAPDIDIKMRENIAKSLLKFKIDGVIISNTTISLRDKLRSKYANETGGLSGSVLFDLSTEIVADIYRFTAGKVPIIAAGGVSNGAEAYQKIRKGASLVQIYSALIYGGFAIIPQINQELAGLLRADGYKNISEAVGVDI